MSTDFTIKQTQQSAYTASGQKSPESDVSVWNNPRAMESTNSATENSNHYYSPTSSVEEVYDQYIRDIAENYQGASEQEVIDILAKLGFTKDFVLQLSKDDFFKFVASFDRIFEFIYETNGDKTQKIDNIADLINYSNSISDKLEVLNSVSDYAYNCGNATFHNMIRLIAKSTDIDLPNEIQEKLKNAKDISELSNDELYAVVMTLISKKDILEKSNNNINTQQLLLNIFFTIPQSSLEENPVLRELLIDEVESAQKANTSSPVIFLAMLKKLNNSHDGINSACNANMLDKTIENIKTPEQTENFLLQAQEIIDSGNVEQKSILADALGKNLASKLDEKSRIDEKIQNGEDLEPSEEDFLNIFEKLEQKYQVVAGHTFVRAQKNIAQQVHNAAEKIGNSFKKGAYQRAYNISLKDKNVDPIDVTKRIDDISNNQYSQVLTELGYELPTTDNIDRLRGEAEQGTFDEKINDYYNSEENTNVFGYSQDSQTAYNDAYSNLEALRLQIINSSASEQNNFTVESNSKTEKNQSEQKNTSNLSGYSGKELSEMITGRLITFGKAVKKYTNLSESAKKYIVDSIKIMDKGRQTFALNSTNNTAKWEIMKKADLLDEDLNVEFDFNHEKLRENYQA